MSAQNPLPLLRPEQLDESQFNLYGKIAHGARAISGVPLQNDDGSLKGPFNAMLLNPTLGDLLQQLGLAVHSTSALEPSIRELVVLRIAAQRGCEPEWRAHIVRAAGIGIPARQLDTVRGGELDGFDAVTAAALVTVDCVLDHSPIPTNVLHTLEDIGGHRAVFELLTLISYYDLLCDLFAAFQIPD